MAMMIPPGKHQRTWDTDDKRLQSFLGLAVWEPQEASQPPKFGAGKTAPLTKRSLKTLSHMEFDASTESVIGSEDGETEESLLTSRKLAWDFGHMDWAIENIKHILQKTRGTLQVSDIDERWFLEAESGSIKRFTARRITPLSRAAVALPYPLYVQGVPDGILELDKTTTKYFARSADRGLCVLPATLRSASFYHLTEEDIRLLAPQVIWVINYRCSSFSIRTEEKFKAALDEWRPFVDPPLLESLYKREQKSRSYLLSEDVKHLLLGA